MAFLTETGSGGAWSVSELTGYIKELFAIDYRLQDVEVQGEISNFVRARSGHLYFTLKDSGAQLKCVMWKSGAAKLRFRPGDGDEVVVSGRISVYEASGQYQLYANKVRPAGRGDLAVAFEQLKARLEAEGLFDEAYKQPIPAFPRKIGIVTSADAAALRDILNVLHRRYPLVQVLISPTLVQGNDAPPRIVEALQWLDTRADIDTIIVTRGGGSIEDLWAFNDERVVRAIFTAQHPIISGVGHETDFTLTDFVADLRAPTPSAAAELAVPDVAELEPLVLGWQAHLSNQMEALLTQRRWQVSSLARSLSHVGPQARLEQNRQRVDTLSQRLAQVMEMTLDRQSGRVAVASARLQAISPLATLARGYAIVMDGDGRVVRSVGEVPAGGNITIHLSDGQLKAQITEKLTNNEK